MKKSEDDKHFFSISMAKELGVNSAILYQNIRHWVIANKANRKNLRDGRYWTFNSVRAFREIFPYLTDSSIKTALDKLESSGYIISGKFNKMGADRTKWYTVPGLSEDHLSEIANGPEVDGQKSPNHLSEIAKPLGENRQPIPDRNTDRNTDSNTPSEGSPNVSDKEAKDQEKFRQYIELCNEHLAIGGVKRNWRPVDGKAKGQFLARLRDGYTGKDFLHAMAAAKKQKNHIDSNFKWLTPEFFTRNDKLQLYASMPVSTQGDSDSTGLRVDAKGRRYYLTPEGTRRYLEPVEGAVAQYSPASNRTFYLIKDADAKQ